MHVLRSNGHADVFFIVRGTSPEVLQTTAEQFLASGREAYENTDVAPGDLIDTLFMRGFWKFVADSKMLAVAWTELNKSYRKEKFVEDSQYIVPEIRASDLRDSYVGTHAQLVSDDGLVAAKISRRPVATGPLPLIPRTDFGGTYI
ncbi:hypothetical protein ACFFQF_29830 [Haladaptatus pallidirubidus]|nr:hypothetical protein [Haladaptatus pallidirubidus]